MAEEIKKILIIKPSALGDIVMAVPAACALAESFPDAQISWFVRPEYSALLAEHKCVHNLIIFDRKRLGKWWYNCRVFAELIRLIIKLRKEKFDIALDFQGRFRSAIFAWLSGCKTRVGIKGTQEITRPFYTQTVSRDENSIHLVDYYLKMVSSVGAKTDSVRFGLVPAATASQQVSEILKKRGAGSRDYAVFVPGSAVEAKCWPIENFAQLADEVSKKYNLDIVATGVQSEKPIAEKLQELSDINVTDLAGETNIAQLIAMLAAAKIVVGNDTGPAHIAAGLGVPMVVIFGQTNPGRVAPYKRPETVAAIDAAGRGDEVESNNPDYDIKNVTVECVFEKVCVQLKNVE